MSLSITFSEPATVNTGGNTLFSDAVWDTGHSNWVLLGIRAGSTSQLQTSPDKTTWTIRTLPSTAAYRRIAYASTLGAAGRLVIVGNGVAGWSDDGGASWSAATVLPEANSWWDVKWWAAQAIFVACASSGTHRIMTSADGKTWVNQTAASALNWSGIEVSSTTAVCVAFLSGSTSTQLIQTSTDGAAWTLQTHTAIETRRGIVAGGQRLGIGYSSTLDMFLITGNDGVNGTRAWRSTNAGVMWTASNAIATIGDTTNRGYVWLNAAGSWYMPCANFNWQESTDGITWTNHASAASHGGYTPMGWRDDSPTLLGGSTLGFDFALVGVVSVPPTLASLSPSNGPSAGGTVVTLTGTHLTGTTAVTFCGVAAVDVIVVSDTTVTCITPAHVGAICDVTLTTAQGSVTLTSAFTFLGVIHVSPRTGTVLGGTAVTITGFGFNAATGVLFDTSAATDMVLDASTPNTKLTAVTPAHASSLVDVTVSGVGVGEDLYTYTLPVPQLQGKGPLLPPIPSRRQR